MQSIQLKCITSIIATLSPFHPTIRSICWLSAEHRSRSPFLRYPCSNTSLFSHAQCSASHIAASPYLVVALLVHYISQPIALAGKAACSLWCGYRIVYCAIPARDPSLINVSLFVLVLCHSSRAGYGTYTITAHHLAALSLLLYLCILLR
jgi:hypothetical protein